MAADITPHDRAAGYGFVERTLVRFRLPHRPVEGREGSGLEVPRQGHRLLRFPAEPAEKRAGGIRKAQRRCTAVAYLDRAGAARVSVVSLDGDRRGTGRATSAPVVGLGREADGCVLEPADDAVAQIVYGQVSHGRASPELL